MSEPIQIEKDKTYVLEVDHVVSTDHVRSIMKDFKESTGSNVIVLHGARLARVASDAEQAIERVRKLHKPHTTNFSNVERLECLGCFTFESDDFGDEWTNYKPYPCETIKALDGETDEA